VTSGGPLARCVADLRLALDVLAGPLDEEGIAWNLTLPDDAGLGDLGSLRLAATFDDPDFPVAREVQAVLRGLCDALGDAGAVIEETTPPVAMRDAMETWTDLVYPMVGLGLPDDVFDSFAAIEVDDNDPGTKALAQFTARFRDRARANQRRQEQRRRWAQYFEDYDAFLAPTLQVPAFPHDHRPTPERTFDVDGRPVAAFDLAAWPSAIGVMLLPAVSIPAGFSDGGLPIGAQIVGPYLRDNRLLRIATLIDEVGPGFRRPPGY
jgi:amidase